MNHLIDFFLPIKSEIVLYTKQLSDTSLGKQAILNHNGFELDVLKGSMVCIGIPESRTEANDISVEIKFDEVRKSFYRLQKGNWDTQIYDLGDIILGESFHDTEIIVQEILTTFLKNQITPIIIGGTHALTYTLFRTYDSLEQKVNLTVVDAVFDLGNIQNPLDEHSFLTHIIMNKPNILFSFANLGYQTYLNSQEEIHLLDDLLFDSYRLGQLKNDMSLVEPILRETDFLSIDLNAVKASDAPAQKNKFISGFDVDEMCQIARYAGLSDKLSLFGLFEYSENLDKEGVTAQMLAQMMWYFIEGFQYRKSEFPDESLINFKKYNVLIDDETFLFYRSDLTGRWWMEINIQEDNKSKRHTLIPCTYQDYESACKMEIPDRWYLNRRKLGD